MSRFDESEAPQNKAGETHAIVIATTKSWNCRLAEELRKKLTNWRICVISERGQLKFEYLSGIEPEFVFFPHWSWSIPKEIYENFKCLAFHMTDLPFGRGGSPLQNLIVKGITETKITAFAVGSEIDAGHIYLKVPLSLHGTAEEIYMRCAKIIFHEMIPYILKERPTPIPQTGPVFRFSRRTPDMSRLTESQTIDQCFDHIRMLDADGYPRAFLRYGNFLLRFSRPKRTSEGIFADVSIEEVKDCE
jgi:methionyl-tRNA formyltransferase